VFGDSRVMAHQLTVGFLSLPGGITIELDEESDFFLTTI
jgi:hypothetical protein